MIVQGAVPAVLCSGRQAPWSRWLCSRAFRSQGSRGSQAAETFMDLRALKEEQVAIARERVFGPQSNMPGDRQLQKKLEGRKLMRWYFPSKYNLQDFRTEEYFEMQSERFAPRAPHAFMPRLSRTLEKVSLHREELRSLFKDMDEATFMESPTLQDLYGLFRLVDADRALPFEPAQQIFLEHSPLCGVSPLLRLTSSSTSSEAEEAELSTLLSVLKTRLSPKEASALEARITRLRSLEEVRSLLLEESQSRNIVPPLDSCTIVLESSQDGLGAELSKAETVSSDTGNSEAHQETAEASEETESKEGLDSLEPPADQESDHSSAPGQQGEKSHANAGVEALPMSRHRLARYAASQQLGGTEKARRKEMQNAEKDLAKIKKEGRPELRSYLSRRHRFVDPMYRRRRLKWLERQMAGLNKEKEVKFNMYYAAHPDKTAEWPTNKGSVTIKWPSPYH